MVDAMLPAPVVVRRKRQHTGNESDDGIRPAGLEEGTVAAIVKENEDAHQQRAGEHGQGNGQPQ
jgi:hypothetical protein